MGTMSIGYWIIQNIGYKNMGLYKKNAFCKIECFVCAEQYDNYRSGIILCVFACRYLYECIFLEYVLHEIYIIISQSNVQGSLHLLYFCVTNCKLLVT